MHDEKPIRVLIADDHDLLRTGLALFFETCGDLVLVGEAANSNDTCQLCETAHPDVVLMDLSMPDMDGVTAARIIRDRFPNIRVIALTSFIDEALVYKALQAGVIGYLIKTISVHELAAAIRDAHRGKMTLASEAVQALVGATHRPPNPTFDLSRRESEVLRLMANWLSNREIAARLSVSVSTAKKHVSRILSKLNTESRTEAVVLAVRHHLVDE